MKTKILIALILTTSQFANAQCVADAGNDTHNCFSDSSIQIGGIPTAIGGTPPYTYEWSIDPIPFVPPTVPFLYASDILDDTTISNPTFVYNEAGDLIPFYLKITDSLGCLSYDTIIVTTSFFGIHLSYWDLWINKGDSIYLNQQPNVDCIGRPCSYLWSPTHGLSDSTLLGGFWAKPDSDIVYSMTATDNKGCSKTGSPFYYIFVRPVGIQSLNEASAIRLFPNPATDFIYIVTENNVQIQHIRLFDLSGKEINIASFGNQIDLRYIPEGMYILEIQTNNKTFRHQIMKKIK